MADLDANLNPSGRRELGYLALAGVVLAISVYLDYHNLFTSRTCWIQRSGAALVIIGAISEAIHIEKVISPDKAITGKPLTRRQAFVVHSGYFTALVGTLLSGYGDLLFKLVFGAQIGSAA